MRLLRYSGRVKTTLACLFLVCVPTLVSAQTENRDGHGSVLVGGYMGLTGGVDYGGQVVATYLPGGDFGRLGVRLDARTFEDETEGLFAMGVTFEAAAARPRLVLNLFAEAGATTHGDVVTGGGIHTTLGVIGPLTLGTDAAAHVIWDGLDTRLVLSGSLLVGLIF